MITYCTLLYVPSRDSYLLYLFAIDFLVEKNGVLSSKMVIESRSGRTAVCSWIWTVSKYAAENAFSVYIQSWFGGPMNELTGWFIVHQPSQCLTLEFSSFPRYYLCVSLSVCATKKLKFKEATLIKSQNQIQAYQRADTSQGSTIRLHPHPPGIN